ncbi:hypothetical protein J3Q64DRAFT_1101923 [Phycomyces blakesleeanus]|uniref:Uncharacterized protein n=2 Tax=Phycomyces blakesleeanus TaxID=4837 RepID=A0A162U8Z6_PHYB8|nr:hypothetical protein PHYBLDRAFT_177585 [Phycomyces blakesleeanus NRRL 1555(-)]OAD73343.1 hypothetical protein PHYBLDRAFT_177585 [Phycomyces blakesleeanus NRRL 1555(-)]|eukprot:XP_018291383.1 hypothetical protein PHYBLDRAFT_177585 [Phycomyces blakesleeanus NRRL 1555(-)]
MPINSRLPPIKVPKTGLVQYLFEGRKFNTPQNKILSIDVATKKTLTLHQIKRDVLRFAAGLQDDCDFKKDDVILIYAPNQYDYAIPLLGAIAAGGAASPANPNYNTGELVYQLEMTKAKILVAHSENIKTALEAAKVVGLPANRIFVFGDDTINGVLPYSALLGDRLAIPVDYTEKEAAESVAILCFSSGTSGKSKGVMTTHTNITSNMEQYYASEREEINPSIDRALGILPFFHIFGLTVVLFSCFSLGIPLFVMPRFDLIAFCETVQNENITMACLVPPIILLLAKHQIIDQYDLSTLRLIISGAAPLSAELSQAATARLKTTVVKQGYGLTETSPVSILERTSKAIAGSTGKIVSNMVAKIVDEDGKEVGPTERGELWLKGPNVMKGYLNNPEATADCIDSEGYFHTGDVVEMDSEGNVYIVDRIKELIKYKGFQVPPAELEAYLLTSPIVMDCAVIGVYDDEQATEIPRAYVVLKEGTAPSVETENIIMKHVADKVVAYKQLRSIVFIAEIPKSASGKILRRVLRDLANEEKKTFIKAKL